MVEQEAFPCFDNRVLCFFDSSVVQEKFLMENLIYKSKIRKDKENKLNNKISNLQMSQRIQNIQGIKIANQFSDLSSRKS